MASYKELRAIVNNQDVRWKTQVAIADVAVDVLAESPTTTPRQDWAKAALASPESTVPELLHYVLIANKASTQQAIIDAADSAYKTNIAAAVTAVYGAAV